MKRRISIAHVIYRLDYGGLENGLVNLVNRLPREEFAHTIIALTGATEFRRRLPADVQVHALHKPPGKSPAYLYRLWRLLRERRFDILHTRNLPCLESQLAGLLAGVPVRIHGEHGWDVVDLHGTRRGYRELRRAFRLVVTRYVVLSRHLEDYLTTSIGVDPQRTSRICNGVDTERFRPDPAGLPASGFVVGAVGRVEPVKDFMTLAQAFVRLAGSSPLPRLTLVGEGSERGAVAAILGDAGLMSRADVAGARDDIPQAMRGFNVFVLPSLAEGISNTILEAMACGLPVIATAVGGNAELVVDGETGYLVPAGNPAAIAQRLRHYLEHPEVAARHGRAARERVMREFSLDAMVAGYRRLYLDSVAADSRLGMAA
ncbi:MAG: TIGR03088 family PEP-CTERM/XrtA system glycosyltransferase [Gammaproteobacteria bacterium]|nr:MAG: TIGR03088 family PEP-CTERM/XrtA system glycosyltransferase [Gammaproteobacteria bacterium]